ncbi:MAG TPA: hypothetical protein VKE22_13330 [Haliangiales bacterium]|nr:hypothetical protein [Haliangiales bacterium]
MAMFVFDVTTERRGDRLTLTLPWFRWLRILWRLLLVVLAFSLVVMVWTAVAHPRYAFRCARAAGTCALTRNDRPRETYRIADMAEAWTDPRDRDAAVGHTIRLRLADGTTPYLQAVESDDPIVVRSYFAAVDRVNAFLAGSGDSVAVEWTEGTSAASWRLQIIEVVGLLAVCITWYVRLRKIELVLDRGAGTFRRVDRRGFGLRTQVFNVPLAAVRDVTKTQEGGATLLRFEADGIEPLELRMRPGTRLEEAERAIAEILGRPIRAA